MDPNMSGAAFMAMPGGAMGFTPMQMVQAQMQAAAQQTAHQMAQCGAHGGGVKSTQYIRRGEDGNDGSGERGSSATTSGDGGGPRYVYRDFSHLPRDASSIDPRTSGISEDGTALALDELRNSKLPAKLNHMLADPQNSHIISWMPHGRAWKILRPQEFTDRVLPRYFESVNYNSFVRLINAWGFRRFTTGRDSNSYYHGKLSLCVPNFGMGRKDLGGSPSERGGSPLERGAYRRGGVSPRRGGEGAWLGGDFPRGYTLLAWNSAYGGLLPRRCNNTNPDHPFASVVLPPKPGGHLSFSFVIHLSGLGYIVFLGLLFQASVPVYE
jgi:hypothetical protein